MAYSRDFILRTLSKDIDKNVAIACFNISYAIGDVNGKISKSTVGFMSPNIDIVPPGVPLVDLSGAVTSSSKWSNILPPIVFSQEVSSKALSVYSALKLDDPSLVVVNSHVGSDLEVKSPLLLGSIPMSHSLKSVINVIYIELFSLYLELLQLTPVVKMANITRIDLTKVDNNIRWLSIQLEAAVHPLYDVLKMLRDIQRTVLFVRSMPSLFIDTYSQRLSQAQGGATQ